MDLAARVPRSMASPAILDRMKVEAGGIERGRRVQIPCFIFARMSDASGGRAAVSPLGGENRETLSFHQVRPALRCAAVPVFSGIFRNLIFKPVLRPLFRVLTGVLAIPAFRFVMKRCFRQKTLSKEMERDLEMWFRGAVILLAATANLEDFLFGWLPWHKSEDPWLTMLLRLLLAIGVIENMPDQDVFAIVHPGPPKVKLTTRAGWKELWRRRSEFLIGLGVLHLKRSSPAFVIMTVIFGNSPGTREFVVGWVFYGLAVAQYLIIGLVTERDRLGGLLEKFDRGADKIRDEIRKERSDAPPGEV
jgi:hypothetical protein